MDFGQWLRSERERLGWSQRDVGDRVGRHVTTVSKWERGGSLPPPDVAVRLARAFDEDPNYLLELAGHADHKFTSTEEIDESLDLPEWLRGVRARSGLTYAEMSTSIYYSRSTLQKWFEYPERVHSARSKRALCWLADLVGEPRRAPLAATGLDRDERLRWVREVAPLPAIYEELGPWLRDVRDRRGWTLVEAGRACGVSDATFHQWERGECKPRFSNCQAIAQALDVPEDEVMRLVGQAVPGGLPAIAGEVRGCDDCPWRERCHNADLAGLPVYCEAADRGNLEWAAQMGKLEALLARYDEQQVERLCSSSSCSEWVGRIE